MGILKIAAAWTVLGTSLATWPARAETANDYLHEVMVEASTCVHEGGSPMECYSKASPQRCKAAAINLVGNPSLFRMTWGRCVLTCGQAGWWDRHVGDCRK